MSIAESAAVDVDIEACARLAQLLRQHSIPADREDSQLEGLTREQVGNFFFFLVAICHQTSPIGRRPVEGTVDRARRRGWDYLLAKFESVVRSDLGLLATRCWSSMTPEVFSRLFSDPELGETLTDVPGRVALVHDLAFVMAENGWSWLEDLFRLSQGRVETGSSNLFELLSRFRAYDDPVRKKSSFLLALMRNNGLWTYRDNERLGTPVDYHEVRGHLRIGTVSVKDPELRRKLLNHVPVTTVEDIAIR